MVIFAILEKMYQSNATIVETEDGQYCRAREVAVDSEGTGRRGGYWTPPLVGLSGDGGLGKAETRRPAQLQLVSSLVPWG